VSAMDASLWERFASFAFYQHALFAGLATALACGLLSLFVVQRRMAFVGQGISHAAFGGMGVALLLELLLPAFRQPLIRDAVVAVFCIGTALAMGRIARARRMGHDSAIGIALVVAMAVGVLLLDVRAEWLRQLSARGEAPLAELAYTPSFHDLLFGNILSIARSAVWFAVVVAAGVSIWLGIVYRGLVFYAADEEAAESFGLPVGFLRNGLLVALGVTIVVAMRLLGVILVSALLILPGAIAGFWARRVPGSLAVSVAASMASIVIGLALSMQLQVLSTGPLIVLVLAALFFGSWVVRRKQ